MMDATSQTEEVLSIETWTQWSNHPSYSKEILTDDKHLDISSPHVSFHHSPTSSQQKKESVDIGCQTITESWFLPQTDDAESQTDNDLLHPMNDDGIIGNGNLRHESNDATNGNYNLPHQSNNGAKREDTYISEKMVDKESQWQDEVLEPFVDNKNLVTLSRSSEPIAYNQVKTYSQTLARAASTSNESLPISLQSSKESVKVIISDNNAKKYIILNDIDCQTDEALLKDLLEKILRGTQRTSSVNSHNDFQYNSFKLYDRNDVITQTDADLTGAHSIDVKDAAVQTIILHDPPNNMVIHYHCNCVSDRRMGSVPVAHFSGNSTSSSWVANQHPRNTCQTEYHNKGMHSAGKQRKIRVRQVDPCITNSTVKSVFINQGRPQRTCQEQNESPDLSNVALRALEILEQTLRHQNHYINSADNHNTEIVDRRPASPEEMCSAMCHICQSCDTEVSWLNSDGSRNSIFYMSPGGSQSHN